MTLELSAELTPDTRKQYYSVETEPNIDELGVVSFTVSDGRYVQTETTYKANIIIQTNAAGLIDYSYLLFYSDGPGYVADGKNSIVSKLFSDDADSARTTVCVQKQSALCIVGGRNDYYFLISDRAHVEGNGTWTLDGKDITAPPPSLVPLPASLPFLLAGLGALSLTRRRRRS